jgi:hypothetical protein
MNRFGVTYVWCRYSPTKNVLDCVMTLSEAVERGFIEAPKGSLKAVQAVGGGR